MDNEVKLHEHIVLPIDSLIEAERNTNEMSDGKFALLVKKIESEWFKDSIYAVKLSWSEEWKYRIIWGHHRVKAAKILGMKEVTAIVHDES